VIDYDGELRALYPHLRAAAAVAPGERVLDIGCGAGQTTRDAARAAAPAPVLGIDISEALLARARDAEGPENVTYVRGDAQTHQFPEAGYDLAISRFGTMFFADPAAAFANIRRALRPGGRLVQLVWQARERNDWAAEIDRALGGPPVPEEAFSLGEPDVARGLLDGFREVEFEEVREPVFYGPDAAAALELVSAFRATAEALARMTPADADDALERLRTMLDAHRGADGVALGARAWVITARR
jgi:SAM-dependent methyltransferase